MIKTLLNDNDLLMSATIPIWSAFSWTYEVGTFECEYAAAFRVMEAKRLLPMRGSPNLPLGSHLLEDDFLATHAWQQKDNGSLLQRRKTWIVWCCPRQRRRMPKPCRWNEVTMWTGNGFTVEYSPVIIVPYERSKAGLRTVCQDYAAQQISVLVCDAQKHCYRRVLSFHVQAYAHSPQQNE